MQYDTPRQRLLFWLKAPGRWLHRLLLLTGIFVWLIIASIAGYSHWLLHTLPDSEHMTMAHLQQVALQKRGETKEEATQEQPTEQQTAEQEKQPQAVSEDVGTSALKNNPATVDHKNWVVIDQISRDLLFTIVLSEDGEYFQHQGIDYDALLAALGENIKRREWKFGASTISQQTAKNLFLDNGKSLARKYQELVVTRRLEQALSKNQILELYLNIAEFGPNLFGVKAAAEYYFETTPNKLNAAQGAFLALLLPSPRRYHYSLVTNGNWSPALRKKMQRILRDMRFKEFISAEQYQSYRKWRYGGLPQKSLNKQPSGST